MSSIAIRACLRSRLTTVAVVVALCGVVAAHHHATMPMPDVHGMPAAAMCLAVLTVVAVAAATVGVVLPGRPGHALLLPRPQLRLVVATVAPRARAGPIFLRLSVLRR